MIKVKVDCFNEIFVLMVDFDVDFDVLFVEMGML